MHASDIAIPLPIVDRTTPALKAAKLIAASDVGGLIVANPDGKPVMVVATVDILRLLLPSYLREDMSLAAVVDEKGAEEMWTNAASRTLGELIDDDAVRMPDLVTVDADATIVEIAAVMADSRARIVLVRGEGDAKPTFVTLPAVMSAIVKFASAAGVTA